MLFGLGLSLGSSSQSAGSNAVLVLVIEHEGKRNMGRDRGVGLGVEANDKAFLLALMTTVAVDFELDVGNSATEADELITLLCAMQLREHVHDLRENSHSENKDRGVS